MNSLKIAELLRKSPIFPQNRRFCKGKLHKVYIKRRLYAQLCDFRLKTEGVPPFLKITKNFRKSPIPWGRLHIFRHLICYSSMNIAELFKNRRICQKIKIAETSVNLKIYIKRRLYAQLGDFRLKTGGVPPFWKITKNRRKSPIPAKRLTEIEN